jgi:hypothetical protein
VPSHPETVVPRACGGSSTPRPIDSIIGVSEILGRPVKPDDDDREHSKTCAPVLAARCARGFASVFTLREKGGRRESRAPIAPAVARKKRTSGPQVNRIIRLSLREGLRLIRGLPGEPCTFATVALRIGDTLQARLGRMHLHTT